MARDLLDEIDVLRSDSKWWAGMHSNYSKAATDREFQLIGRIDRLKEAILKTHAGVDIEHDCEICAAVAADDKLDWEDESP